MSRTVLIGALVVALIFLSPFVAPQGTSADSIDQIQEQIDDIARERAKLDAEIAAYERQLTTLAGEKQTLQGAISTLDVSRQKTAAQIQDIQKKISAATLKLSQLSLDIGDKEQSIALDRAAVAAALRAIDSADDVSLIEQILATDKLAETWIAVDNLSALSEALYTHASLLSVAKSALAKQHSSVVETKSELSSAGIDLGNQKKALDVNRAEKQNLLSATQSKEAEYQALIAEKRRQQKEFDSELRALEDTLMTIIDPTAIASAGSGVLKWPFSNSYMEGCRSKEGALGNSQCITQYFGNTSFSTANPQVYNGSGHNGVDFSAPTGTPIEAALGGSVLDTGNTDATPGCYSFGKWVVVTHANGLSTLYSHLSSISVTKGESVGTGAVVGYSGMTGYATGPHLHFAVYASQGLQISSLAAFRGATSPCASAKIPVAPRDAYLNPMSYL
ncbi:MAG: peptidoglycan DD-metalloendopeptidase family protein [Minisyncoccia bacterium]